MMTTPDRAVEEECRCILLEEEADECRCILLEEECRCILLEENERVNTKYM
jgi:hypothetical protein